MEGAMRLPRRRRNNPIHNVWNGAPFCRWVVCPPQRRRRRVHTSERLGRCGGVRRRITMERWRQPAEPLLPSRASNERCCVRLTSRHDILFSHFPTVKEPNRREERGKLSKASQPLVCVAPYSPPTPPCACVYRVWLCVSNQLPFERETTNCLNGLIERKVKFKNPAKSKKNGRKTNCSNVTSQRAG
jgi:hypothetical protein